jgi:hypothetical protein
MHQHRTKTYIDRPFAGPVVAASDAHRAAHGNITRHATCACGASRRMNINGRHVEAGAWTVRVTR